MNGRPHQAEILLALAALGTGSFRLDGGRLDRALRDMEDDLPEGLRGKLTFGCGSVGLRCYELPEILDRAFYMLLADYGPRGDHNTLHSKLQAEEAREIAIQYSSTISDSHASPPSYLTTICETISQRLDGFLFSDIRNAKCEQGAT